MDRRPTIIDVAKHAGVSKSTVSLVLQNSPVVKATTRDEVRRAMVELGYVYNRSAANLRSANAGLIGLVINDLRNPFFTEFATSVQMALSERGYATVLANTDETPTLQAQVTAAMIEHGASALILSPAYGEEDATFGALSRAGIPAMQVLRQVVPTDRFPFAAPDYESGGRLAALHLLARGARKIAFVGGLEGRSVTQRRMSGYLAVLVEAGLPPLVLPGRPGRAFGLHSGCAEIGRRVGQDLMIIGFDDIEDCAQVWPALTSVSCGIARFGQTCAQTVLAWLEDGTAPPLETRSPVALICRASTKD
jgi:LacI family transcriptional regulator